MGWDWGNAAKGAVEGALGGSTFGPWGATAGGLANGLAQGFSGNKKSKNKSSVPFSTPDQHLQISNYSPEQQRGLAQVFEQMNKAKGPYDRALNYANSILSGDPESFDKFSAPYLQQLEQQILPRISEKFAGLGGGMGGGVGSSSGFAQALGGASSDLSSRLAYDYNNLQRGLSSDVMQNYNQLANIGLSQRPHENAFQQGDVGPFGPILEELSAQGSNKLVSMVLDWLKNKKGSGNNSLSDSISNKPAAGPGGDGATYNAYTGVQE